jgi:hypothetical protein
MAPYNNALKTDVSKVSRLLRSAKAAPLLPRRLAQRYAAQIPSHERWGCPYSKYGNPFDAGARISSITRDPERSRRERCVGRQLPLFVR